jgi:tetratricopeptide (TPR) repeat protein
MDAMALDTAHPRLSQLWQLPLLLVSLGLFGFAAYLFIDPKPGITTQQRIDIARTYLSEERPEAAIEQLNDLLLTEKLHPEDKGQVHVLLAEALELGQRQRRISIPANHHRIIEQTQLALGTGLEATADMHRRLAESYEALNRPREALGHYRQAMSLDRAYAIHLQRRVIDLQLGQGEAGAAGESLEAYLRSAGLTDAERAWAVSEQAQLRIEAGEFDAARALLLDALKLDMDPVAQGQIHYRLGYCAWKLGDLDEAERLLRIAREQLRIRHPLDAYACYVLGRIHQQRNEPLEAVSFYQIVLTSHPDSDVAPLARLGRGLSRLMSGEHEPGLQDLDDVVKHIQARPSRMRFAEEAVAGLRQGAEILARAENYQGALEMMVHEQSLLEEPGAAFFARLAVVYERRGDQVERGIEDATPAERIRRMEQARELLTKAGDACIAYSRALVLVDDRGYGDSMWRGVELYDRAGNLQRVISALELFVAERPDDALAPDALLRLGRAYQMGGMFDRAIGALQRNQMRYPQSLAAAKSAVPLAQAYVAQGPQSYAKAETVLLGVLDNNPLLTPESAEFRAALLEIAQLYYRTGKFEQAIARLEESIQRYPDDADMGQILFLMADSYRKSAGLLDAHLSTATASAEGGGAQAAEAGKARRERLVQARLLYDRVIEIYRESPPGDETGVIHQKLSHFYRADCLFDLGEFEEAIRLYDAAAFRYQNDPSSLAAFVQIVNAYCAMEKLDEARTANERAKWMLRRMPAEAFGEGAFSMPKGHWEQWLKWTAEAGMW